MRIVSATLLLIFMASGSIATAAEEKSAGQAASEPAVKEKRVCRRETQTGSRLPTRTCHSASEWAQIDKETQERASREVERVAAIGRSDGSGFNAN